MKWGWNMIFRLRKIGLSEMGAELDFRMGKMGILSKREKLIKQQNILLSNLNVGFGIQI